MPFNAGKQPQEDAPPPIGISVLTTARDEMSSPGLDIVFVHGLRGHREKTWTSKSGVFWPRDLLPKDLPGTRVMSWGYDAAVVQFFSSESASQASLFAHGKSLLEDISAKRRRGRKRPILWVCHSLGGLVVKAALIAANGYGKNERFPELGAVYEATIGVLFMGTPHRGSSREEDLGQVAKLAATITMHDVNSQLLRTLAPNSHILEEQRDAFTTISKDLDVVCFWEELKTRPVGLIVPESSAVYDGFRVRSQGIRASHSDMVKFSETDDAGYERVLNHMERIFEEHEEKVAALARPVPSLHHQDIKNSLSFMTIHKREDSIESAHNATFSWILEEQSLLFRFGVSHPASRFVSWLKTNMEPLFWISGKAGSGKSTLMKYIYGDPRLKKYLEAWARDRPLVLCQFFLSERGDKLQKSQEGMLRSLLLQLIKEQPELAKEAFPRLFDSAPDDTPVVPVDWDSLKKAMTRVIDHARRKEWVICMFIDGLDEYRNTGGKGDFPDAEDVFNNDMAVDSDQGSDSPIHISHYDVIMFILELLSTSRGSLKLCVSSRELNIFEKKFATYPRLRVHEHTAEDTRKYAMAKLTDAQVLDADERKELVDQIVNKSHGVFLWVRLVVARGTRRFSRDRCPTLQKALEWLDLLPDELGGKEGLYSGMMNYVDPKDRLDGSRVIRLIGAANGAFLPFCAITHALRLTDETGRIDVDRVVDKDRVKNWRWHSFWPGERTWLQERLKDCTGGLVECEHGPTKENFVFNELNFIHQTAKEFILDEVTWNDTFGPNTDWGFDGNLSLLAGLVACLTDVEKMDVPSLKLLLFEEAMVCGRLADSEGRESSAYIGLVDGLFRAVCSKAVAETWLQNWFVEDRKTAPVINLKLPLARHDPGQHEVVGIMRREYSTPKICASVYVSIYGGLLNYVMAKYGRKPACPSDVLAISDLWDQFLLYPSVVQRKYFRPILADDSSGPLLSYYFPRPETAEILLEIGATPGVAWDVLLRLGYCVFAADRLQDVGTRDRRRGLMVENRRRWIGIADALVRHGVDFHTPVQLGNIPSEFLNYYRTETQLRREWRSKCKTWVIDLATVLWTVCEHDMHKYAAVIKRLGLDDKLIWLSPPEPWPGYGHLVIDKRFYTGEGGVSYAFRVFNL
ncbi:hypothetical protein V8F06_012734 [Rhypophila decipiens]